MVKRFDQLIRILGVSAASQVSLFGQGFITFPAILEARSSGSIGQPPRPFKAGTFVPPPIFQDVAAQAGVTVSHISSPEKKFIVESMSGGVGLFDCDDRLDIGWSMASSWTGSCKLSVLELRGF
jgi:hypothetical protein